MNWSASKIPLTRFASRAKPLPWTILCPNTPCRRLATGSGPTTASPIFRQGVKTKTNDNVLKVKLSLNWTDPLSILAVGPPSSAPDGQPVGEKLPYMDLKSALRDTGAKPRVFVARCKRCLNLHDVRDMPEYLPGGLMQYILKTARRKPRPTTSRRRMYRNRRNG